MGDTDAAKEHLHLAAYVACDCGAAVVISVCVCSPIEFRFLRFRELDPKNAEIPIQARRIREAEERYRELQRRDDEILRQKLATTSLS